MAQQEESPERWPETRRVSQYEFYYLLRRADLVFTTKGLGLFYATYASPEGGKIFPRQERVILESGLKERALRDHTKLLRKLGLLTQVRAHSPFDSAEYELSWPVDPELVAMRLDLDGGVLIPLPVVKAKGGKRRGGAGVESEPDDEHRRPDAGTDEHRRGDAGTESEPEPEQRRGDAGTEEGSDTPHRRPDAGAGSVDNPPQRRPDAGIPEDPDEAQRRGDAPRTGVGTPLTPASPRRHTGVGTPPYQTDQTFTKTNTSGSSQASTSLGDQNGHHQTKIDLSPGQPTDADVTDEDYNTARATLSVLPDLGARYLDLARAAYAANGDPNPSLREAFTLAADFATTDTRPPRST